jgi:hypothetical protein
MSCKPKPISKISRIAVNKMAGFVEKRFASFVWGIDERVKKRIGISKIDRITEAIKSLMLMGL